MRTLALLVLLLAPPASSAELTDVVAAALARSPAVAEPRARRLQAEAAGREVLWSRWPRLSARASLLRGDDPLFAFGGRLQARRVSAADFNPATLNQPGYRTAAQAALELSLPVFTGFERARAAALAGLAADEAGAFVDSASQAVRVLAADAYLRDLKQRALLAELDARLASARSAIAGAERLKRQGLVLGSDHQAALALLSGLKAWRARAAAEREANQAGLAVLVGGFAPETVGTLREWLPPPENGAALSATALDTRPDLRAAASRAQAAGVVREGAARSLLPSVEAFASVSAASEVAATGAGSRLFGVRASLPFGDPAYRSRLARAQAGESAALAAQAGAQDAARGETLARAASLRGLAAALPEALEALARARDALEQARPLYREGRLSVLEVLRAEEAVARLEDARLDTLWRLRSEWAASLAAQGRFDDAALAALAASIQELP